MRRVLVSTAVVAALASAVLADVSPATRPADVAATRPLADVDDLLGLVPADVLPDDVRGWTVAKMGVANEVLKARAVGRQVRLKGWVTAVSTDDRSGYKVGCNVGGRVAFGIGASLRFGPADDVAAARLRVGDEVVVLGTVTAATFGVAQTLNGAINKVRLVTTLSDIRVERVAKPDVPPSPGVPTSRPTLAGIGGVLGVIPAGVLPADAGHWTDAKRDVADAALSADAVGRDVRLRVRVTGVTRDGTSYVASADPVSGPAVPADAAGVQVRFTGDAETLAAARLQADDEVALTATVDGASFDLRQQNGQPDQTTFTLAVDHPRIDPAAARPPATRPADPPVRDLADLISTVPAGVTPPVANGWTDAKIDAANRALAA